MICSVSCWRELLSLPNLSFLVLTWDCENTFPLFFFLSLVPPYSPSVPDENYAREVMQLFSIGLTKLNLDGTPVIDRYGREIPTYDVEDVASLARVWTGFNGSLRRGNYEDLDWAGDSYMDPMSISLKMHDFFPKRGLDKLYIGDKLPLCVDMPTRAFLRVGAKYRLLGGSSTPRLQEDPASWDKDDSIFRMILNPFGNSALREELCHPVNGECTYPSIIELPSNLVCHEMECKVDTVRVVQVAQGVFYEYVRQACVQLAFYEGAKKVFSGNDSFNMCANPKMPVARAACCGLSWKDNWPIHQCKYAGERVTYQTYQDRCDFEGGPLNKRANTCAGGRWGTPWWVYNQPNFGWLNQYQKCEVDSLKSSPYWVSDSNFQWTPEPCNIEIAVNSNGHVQVIHVNDGTPPASPHVEGVDNINWFSVHWERNVMGDEQYPSAKHNSCGEGACKVDENVDVMGRLACRCSTMVEETAVFAETPTREEALVQLHIGAFELGMFNTEDYVLVGSVGGVETYRPAASAEIFTMETVFKLHNKARQSIFLKNMKSVVKVRLICTYRNNTGTVLTLVEFISTQT